MSFFVWLQALDISQWIVRSAWAEPILLCFHAIGMGIVVGVVLMLDARVLGYPKSIPTAGFERFLQIAWWGFVVNAISGLILFIANAARLITNWTFDLKMLLILAGGFSLWLLWRALQSEKQNGSPRPFDRLLAGLSILFWLGAITSGRMIAYTLPPG